MKLGLSRDPSLLRSFSPRLHAQFFYTFLTGHHQNAAFTPVWMELYAGLSSIILIKAQKNGCHTDKRHSSHFFTCV